MLKPSALIRVLACAASLLTLAGGLVSGLAAAAEPGAAGTGPAPSYAAEPCCQLCPRAADPAAYDNGGKTLEDFRMLVAGRPGWLFRTSLDLATRFDVSDDSLAEMHRLVVALRQRGTELLLVYQPPRGLADVHQLSPQLRAGYDYAEARRSYAQALARLRSSGAIVPALDALADQPDDYDYYFRRDHHWTPRGAEATAKLVADAVRALPLKDSLPKRSYTTRQKGIIAKPGTLQKVAAQICGGGAWSQQFVPAFQTESTGGGDLLGDDAVPEVTLVGTSNSDAKGGYNFDGYLEAALEAEVLNVAITGGSFEGSLLKYLASPGFQKHPPKLLIWEMPYQDYPDASKNPHKVFRQALPLVNDGCRSRPLLMSKTLSLLAGSNEVLFNGGGPIAALVGGKLALDVQFSDPAVKAFTGTVWYFNGLKEELKLEFKPYVDNAGRFVTELRNDREDYANATMLGVTVELDQAPAKPLTVTAKLCAR